MKVTSKGVSITEVPGFKEIRVEADLFSRRGVHIALDDRQDESNDCYECGRPFVRSFGITEARELRDALTVALKHADQLASSL